MSNQIIICGTCNKREKKRDKTNKYSYRVYILLVSVTDFRYSYVLSQVCEIPCNSDSKMNLVQS